MNGRDTRSAQYATMGAHGNSPPTRPGSNTWVSKYIRSTFSALVRRMRPTPSAASWAQSRFMTFGLGRASRRSTGGRAGTGPSKTQRRTTDSGPADSTSPVPAGPSTSPTRTRTPGAARSTVRKCPARPSRNSTRPSAPTSASLLPPPFSLLAPLTPRRADGIMDATGGGGPGEP